jgi:hypothetical protein
MVVTLLVVTIRFTARVAGVEESISCAMDCCVF